jgi:hypothetical protein
VLCCIERVVAPRRFAAAHIVSYGTPKILALY